MTHPALQSAFDAIDDMVTPDAWQIAATVKGLMEGYHHRWLDQNQYIELIEIEKMYESALTNVETGRDSRTFTLAGKIDKLVETIWDGMTLIDHKTTSENIVDPDSSYWRQLQVSGQYRHYEILLLQNGIKLNRVVWDVIKKPGIRPKKLSKADRQHVVADGEYFGRPVSGETQSYLADNERENGELYQIRLAELCTEKGDEFFQRRSVVRTNQELLDYAADLWDVGQDMLASRNNNRHTKNGGACMQWGSPCDFLGICSNHDTPTSDKWKLKDCVHTELEGLDSDGRDVITNSRVGCYQTCKQKHHLRYNIGIERVDAEEKEALYFGKVWHAACDAWWQSISNHEESNDVNGNRESVVSEATNCEAKEELAF